MTMTTKFMKSNCIYNEKLYKLNKMSRYLFRDLLFEREFEKSIEKFVKELKLVACVARSELYNKHRVKDYPTFKYSSFRNNIVTSYIGRRKIEDFVSFFHVNMGLKREMAKSATASPTEGFGNGVQILTDDDFEQTIGKGSPVFVMFFATWCSYCTPAKKIFSNIASKIAKENLNVRLAAIDAAENPKTADFAHIKELPTFKLFYEGKETSVFNGYRSTDNLFQFIKNELPKFKQQ